MLGSTMKLRALLILATHFVGLAVAQPTVTLDNGTFTGTTSGSVSRFLGIPFAQPP
jgi:acetylcholinesterase